MSTIGNGATQFIFRKNDEIGAAGAEDDERYLASCFVDTGDLEILSDCANPKRIIVGRTGSGKTALLTELEQKKQNVIVLSPHALSINYIANNSVIRFFEEAGVNLSPFYGLLWKHIIVVELLNNKFDMRSEDSQRVGMDKLRRLLSKDNIREQAVDYLEKWGNKFWLTTEDRMHELTTRIEKSLTASVDATMDVVELSAKGAEQLTSEESKKIVESGRQAVSEVQIRELENLITILDEVIFTDRQQHYYITIDTLDEEWADDRIRYRLIKSLIDTVRRFRKVGNIKIIIALRQDLLDKVLHSSTDVGFQEEKYESLYLYVRWTKSQLKELIGVRLNMLIKNRYTKNEVKVEDLFPTSVDGQTALDYIITRTFLRPRDAILFVNDCISLAERRPALTAAMVKMAEEEYSHKRLQSLATEWQIIYPNLKSVAQMFYGMNDHFKVSDMTKEFICKIYESVAREIENTASDPITASLDKLYTESGNFGAIRNTLIRTLHFVGLVGLKVGPTSSVNWAYESRLSLAPGEIKSNSTVYIHPMFYRALGVRVKRTPKAGQVAK